MKDNENKGKRFYSCSKPQGSDSRCDFFLWEPAAPEPGRNGLQMEEHPADIGDADELLDQISARARESRIENRMAKSMTRGRGGRGGGSKRGGRGGGSRDGGRGGGGGVGGKSWTRGKSWSRGGRGSWPAKNDDEDEDGNFL